MRRCTLRSGFTSCIVLLGVGPRIVDALHRINPFLGDADSQTDDFAVFQIHPTDGHVDYALVVRREHLRANLTPLAKRAADPSNRVYPSPPQP